MKLDETILFAPKDVRTHLNIPKPTWAAWTARGFLIPSYKGTGRGSTNMYTYKDVIKIKLIMDLSASGMNLKTASEIAYSVEVEDGFDKMDEYMVEMFLTGAVTLTISLSDIADSLK